MLRAEEMDHNIWWWAVSEDEGLGHEISSSNYEDRECLTGVIARQRAEECARTYLSVARQKKNARVQAETRQPSLAGPSSTSPLS